MPLVLGICSLFLKLSKQAFDFVYDSVVEGEETKEKIPLLDESKIVGSLYMTKGMNIGGSSVTSALSRDASAMTGARFVGHTHVSELVIEKGAIKGVKTTNPEMPDIACDYVVVASNIWAPALSERYDVHLPLMAFEHQYVVTEPVEALAQFDPNKPEQEVYYPNFRDLNSATYGRQHWNSYGVGSYQHRPLMVRPKDVKKTAMHPFTPEDMVNAWSWMQELLPALKGKEFVRSFNGMFAFSIDGMPIIGESKIRGLWSAVASWITHAGGVGKSVAEWMTTGETEWDMRACHIHRFLDFSTTDTYMSIICPKNYRELYDIIHPKQPPTEPRNVRMSAFADRHAKADVEYTVFAGLELPNWFHSNAHLVDRYRPQIPEREGWAAKFWSPIQGAEHLEVRDNVGMFDLSGLSIIEVKGEKALDYVNYLCSSQMNKPVGSTIYTCWLTPSGGIKRDLAVARLAEDCFWMFVGEGTRPQDLDWVKTNAPATGLAVNDISDGYSAIGLWGPHARKVLEKVTPDDVSNEGFPYFTARWLEVGMARVLALRVSYAGELGWELHIPHDLSLKVWDTLRGAGEEFSMIAAGMGCFDSLRLEKGYRGWGADIHSEYSPYQAGLGWTVHLKKRQDFIGKETCKSLKTQPLTKKLCCLTSEHPEAMALGYEAVLHEGEAVGYITSANYAYSMGCFVAYSYLPSELSEPGTSVEVLYFGEAIPFVVSEEPLFDPEMARLKA